MAEKTVGITIRCSEDERAQVQALADRYTGGNVTRLLLGVTVGDGTEALTVALEDPTLAMGLFNHCQLFSLDWRELARDALVRAMRESV